MDRVGGWGIGGGNEAGRGQGRGGLVAVTRRVVDRVGGGLVAVPSGEA